MRELLEEIALSLSPASSQDFVVNEKKLDPVLSTRWLISNCHGWLYSLALIVPSLLFLVYLALQVKKSFTKLFHGRSYIMIAYYGLVWLVSLLNLAWCAFQTWECTPGKEFSWNILSLFTSSGMLFLEISLLAFLLQGNYSSGLEALTRTFIISGIILSVDILLKAIYVFGFGVPLFIDLDGSTNKVKWGLWIFHNLLLTAVYGIILFMHHTKHRERLPARPAFYNYIFVMLCLNAIGLFACLFVASRAAFGFWLYNFTTICYHAFYLPLIYVTFLADFFQVYPLLATLAMAYQSLGVVYGDIRTSPLYVFSTVAFSDPEE